MNDTTNRTNSTTTTSPASRDPRPAVREAIDTLGTVVGGIDPSQGNLPTPCEDWDVATLVNHVQAVIRRLGAVVSGVPFDQTPRMVDSTDWTGDWQAGASDTLAAIADDDVLTRACILPWGSTPGAGAIAGYVGELTVHAWDLARATGQPLSVSDGVIDAAHTAYQRMLPPVRDEDIPFGADLSTGDHADALDRLVAFTGRDPQWTAG